MNIHLENGIPRASVFFYEEVPMAFRQSGVDRMKALTARFAPLLRTFGDKVEIDWEFYAQACAVYQDLMNRILLALGVLTFQAHGNLQITHMHDPACRSFMPRALNRRLYFHRKRFNDALSFIEVSAEIFAKRNVSVSPHELQATEMVLRGDLFDPNAVTAEVIITNKLPLAG